ncbi:MAG TPA: IspD/TarI family cytidylyltransferase [Victivallales bacterium]|nr:IspD/TarI family cytidylyltransferase [Victivallales bacterium]
MVAGGSSRRFGKNKLFEKILNLPVFILSIIPFTLISQCKNNIVLVINSEFKDAFSSDLQKYLPSAKIKIINGGTTRAESVKNGLIALSPVSPDLVAVHDAARPLIDISLIRKAFLYAQKNSSAVFAYPLSDTIKLINKKNMTIKKTLDRKYLWAAQTPQIFRYTELLDAYEKEKKSLHNFTDDASIMESAGYKIKIFPSSQINLKITYQTDLLIANAICKNGYFSLPQIKN